MGHPILTQEEVGSSETCCLPLQNEVRLCPSISQFQQWHKNFLLIQSDHKVRVSPSGRHRTKLHLLYSPKWILCLLSYLTDISKGVIQIGTKFPSGTCFHENVALRLHENSSTSTNLNCLGYLQLTSSSKSPVILSLASLTTNTFLPHPSNR